MAHPNPFGMIVCDPGPCNPGALTVVQRDFGLWILLIFTAAAFAAGRKALLSNLLLPALCMATIAAAFYLNLHQKIGRIRDILVSHDGLSAMNLQSLEMGREETLRFYAIGYLTFAVGPFLLGILIAAIRRRKLKQSHA